MDDRPWTTLIDPIAKKYELAAKLDMQYCEGPSGCKAIATLLRDMARIIDDEIVKRNKIA